MQQRFWPHLGCSIKDSQIDYQKKPMKLWFAGNRWLHQTRRSLRIKDYVTKHIYQCDIYRLT